MPAPSLSTISSLNKKDVSWMMRQVTVVDVGMAFVILAKWAVLLSMHR